MFSATDCHGPGMLYIFACSNVPVSAMCWDHDLAYDCSTPTWARAGRPTDARRLLTSDTNWDSAEESNPATRCGSVVVVVVGAGADVVGVVGVTVVVVTVGGTVVVVTGVFTVAAAAGAAVVVGGAFVVVVTTWVVVVGATVVDVVVDVVVTGTAVVLVLVDVVVVDGEFRDAATTSGAGSGTVVPGSPNAGTMTTAERIATNASRMRDNDRGFMRALVRGQ